MRPLTSLVARRLARQGNNMKRGSYIFGAVGALGVGVGAVGVATGAGTLGGIAGIALGAATITAAGEVWRVGARSITKALAIDNLVTRARGGSKMPSGARAALVRAAAARSTVAGRSRGSAAGILASRTPAGDGQTDSYTRMQNGKSVTVRGYTTPAR